MYSQTLKSSTIEIPTDEVCEAENVMRNSINPLIPDAHYSERRDKLTSLQEKR